MIEIYQETVSIFEASQIVRNRALCSSNLESIRMLTRVHSRLAERHEELSALLRIEFDVIMSQKGTNR